MVPCHCAVDSSHTAEKDNTDRYIVDVTALYILWSEWMQLIAGSSSHDVLRNEHRRAANGWATPASDSRRSLYRASLCSMGSTVAIPMPPENTSSLRVAFSSSLDIAWPPKGPCMRTGTFWYFPARRASTISCIRAHESVSCGGNASMSRQQCSEHQLCLLSTATREVNELQMNVYALCLGAFVPSEATPSTSTGEGPCKEREAWGVRTRAQGSLHLHCSSMELAQAGSVELEATVKGWCLPLLAVGMLSHT